jgi:hypothetical protein
MEFTHFCHRRALYAEFAACGCAPARAVYALAIGWAAAELLRDGNRASGRERLAAASIRAVPPTVAAAFSPLASGDNVLYLAERGPRRHAARQRSDGDRRRSGEGNDARLQRALCGGRRARPGPTRRSVRDRDRQWPLPHLSVSRLWSQGSSKAFMMCSCLRCSRRSPPAEEAETAR